MSRRTKRQMQETTTVPSKPIRRVALLRKCACGKHTIAGGTCAECRQKRETALQHTAISLENAVPPIVHDVLNTPGQPLDTGTRTLMEPRLGRDFSHVRIHTDAHAAQSAQAVNAQAYTVGQDLVFGPGQYAPETQEGTKLLAHELTHVVQQGGDASHDKLELGATGDAYEREAEQQSTHIVQNSFLPGSPRPVAHVTSAPKANIVQRSVLGSILGGVLGAIGGAVIGAVLGGPVGAIVGAGLGLVGGALIGNTASTKERPLTSDEKSYAHEVFQDSIDYSRITITRDSLFAVGAPRTIGNTIHLKSSWNHFKGDTMELTEEGKLALIHEMGHVWQYQNGGLAYIPESLWAQFKAAIGSGSRGAAYDWRQAHQSGLPWEKWNPEQQAGAIEDYNKALRRSKDGTATLEDFHDLSTLKPYMEKVRARQGAPSFGSAPDPRKVGL